MKHAGKAAQAGLRIIWWSLFLLLALMISGMLAKLLGGAIVEIGGVLAGLWVLFALFCLYFFRDPEPRVPAGENLVLSPATGKVDMIEERDEPEFMGGRCRRISIFLSVVDVHVQRAPVAGKVGWSRYQSGQFLNALRADSAEHNESLYLGLESTAVPGGKVGIRLIAGVIARRIVGWVQLGDPVGRGDRLSLIQFGSRVDLYLPLAAVVQVQLGDRVIGGETVVARWG